MKITKNELIQLIKEELEVILTDDEAEEMFGIDVSAYSELQEASLEQTTPEGLPRVPRGSQIPTEKIPALQRPGKVWTESQRIALLEILGKIEARLVNIESAMDKAKIPLPLEE